MFVVHLFLRWFEGIANSRIWMEREKERRQKRERGAYIDSHMHTHIHKIPYMTKKGGREREEEACKQRDKKCNKREGGREKGE